MIICINNCECCHNSYVWHRYWCTILLWLLLLAATLTTITLNNIISIITKQLFSILDYYNQFLHHVPLPSQWMDNTYHRIEVLLMEDKNLHAPALYVSSLSVSVLVAGRYWLYMWWIFLDPRGCLTPLSLLLDDIIFGFCVSYEVPYEAVRRWKKKKNEILSILAEKEKERKNSGVKATPPLILRLVTFILI